MTVLTISPELTKLLATEAERTGTTISELAEAWLRQQYAALRHEQLAIQTQRFWTKQGELYPHYPNQYVAFYDDQVLDHDTDIRQLALRVKATYGLLPIVIAQVTESPVRGYKMRSPRLKQPSL